MVILGAHISGMGGAKRTIKKQKKIFSRLGLPGAEEFFHGTINLYTSPKKFKPLSFNYFFDNVQYKSFPRKRTEDFGFITILLLTHNTKEYKNWGYIYIPHKSPHYGNSQMFELVGKQIEGLNPGDSLEIKIEDGLMAELL